MNLLAKTNILNVVKAKKKMPFLSWVYAENLLLYAIQSEKGRGEAHRIGSPDEGHRAAECVVQCREDLGMHMLTHIRDTQ